MLMQHKICPIRIIDNLKRGCCIQEEGKQANVLETHCEILSQTGKRVFNVAQHMMLLSSER